MLTPLTAMNFVAIAYTLAILLTIIVEFRPLGRFRRVSAFAALALASAGGVAWTYAAFYSHSEWPELYASQTPQDDSNHNPKRHVAGGRDEDSDTEAASGRSVTGGSRKVMAERGQASRGALGNEASVQARLARVLGLAARPEPAAEEAIIDCEGCPPMIPVPAGTAIIGAADGDNDATEAEYPRRAVRFWPGYLISAEPVSASSFREFMAASGRRQWSCGPKMAALDVQGSELLMTTLVVQLLHVLCRVMQTPTPSGFHLEPASSFDCQRPLNGNMQHEPCPLVQWQWVVLPNWWEIAGTHKFQHFEPKKLPQRPA